MWLKDQEKQRIQVVRLGTARVPLKPLGIFAVFIKLNYSFQDWSLKTKVYLHLYLMKAIRFSMHKQVRICLWESRTLLPKL